MRRITAAEAEAWVNLPELRRYQFGPVIPRGEEQRVSLAHLEERALILEHDGCLGIFDPAPFDGIWFGHHAIPRTRWGKRGAAAASAILVQFFEGVRIAPRVRRVVGWTLESNPLSVKFARRLGFEIDGYLPYDGDRVVSLGASRCQVAAAAKFL